MLKSNKIYVLKNVKLFCYVILCLVNWADFIKTLKNADQIYHYLMQLLLSMRIGPSINCKKKRFMVIKDKCVYFV